MEKKDGNREYFMAIEFMLWNLRFVAVEHKRGLLMLNFSSNQ